MRSLDYLADVVRLLRTNHPWERPQFFKLFPIRPATFYRMMAQAGFSGTDYRNSWPDLQATLTFNNAAEMHFVQFNEDETRFPRRFPIDLDFPKLRALAGRHVRDRVKLAGIVRCLLQAQIDYRPQCLSQPSFWREALAVCAELGSPCVIFGDSHSLIFRQTVKEAGRLILPLHILCGGGSATGLPNPASRSGYGATIEGACKALADAQLQVPVCLAFGQVDIEFVQTYRRLKAQDRTFDQAGFEAFCADVTARYAAWIAGLAARNVVVLGVNPPCVDDEHLLETYLTQMQVYVGGGIADVRDGETAELLGAELPHLDLPPKIARTANHRLFNRFLQRACRSQGLRFADSFDRFLGADGCIRREATCASIDGVMQVGTMGRDIHVAGPFARAIKAGLVAQAVAGTPGSGPMPRPVP